MTAPDLAMGISDRNIAPLNDGVAVTPADDSDLVALTRAIMVATAGNVSIMTASGTTLTLPGLQPGMIYPIRASRIRATGTTATGIVGLW